MNRKKIVVFCNPIVPNFTVEETKLMNAPTIGAMYYSCKSERYTTCVRNCLSRRLAPI